MTDPTSRPSHDAGHLRRRSTRATRRRRRHATPSTTPPTVDAAVARAREAAAWWADLVVRRARAELLDQWRGVITRRIGQLADVVHRETGKPHADAQLEIALAVDHLAWAAKHAEKVLGRHRGLPGAADGQPGRHRGVPAARRRRRDRPLELPGLHADGLDRLRPGRRQRRGVQAQRANPGRRRLARRRLRARSCPAATCSRSSPGRGETGAALCRRRRRQARLHRLHRDRQEGDGGLRGEPHPGAHRGRRQGRAASSTRTPTWPPRPTPPLWGAFSNAGQTCIGVERVYVHERVYADFVAELTRAGRGRPRRVRRRARSTGR